MGVIDVPMKAVKNFPVLMGERDVMKIIQLLPGVQAGQEGTAGFYVRGGNLDQNHVHLYEATVYNPIICLDYSAHLMSILSIKCN
jgi:hypothetical protein